MRRSRIVGEDDRADLYSRLLAVGVGVDVTLLIALGFALGRLWGTFFG